MACQDKNDAVETAKREYIEAWVFCTMLIDVVRKAIMVCL